MNGHDDFRSWATPLSDRPSIHHSSSDGKGIRFPVFLLPGQDPSIITNYLRNELSHSDDPHQKPLVWHEDSTTQPQSVIVHVRSGTQSTVRSMSENLSLVGPSARRLTCVGPMWVGAAPESSRLEPVVAFFSSPSMGGTEAVEIDVTDIHSLEYREIGSGGTGSGSQRTNLIMCHRLTPDPFRRLDQPGMNTDSSQGIGIRRSAPISGGITEPDGLDPVILDSWDLEYQESHPDTLLCPCPDDRNSFLPTSDV